MEGWSIRRCPTPARPSAPRSHLPEVPDRPDAVAQQDGGRVDGAGGEDHLPAAELPLLAVHQRRHADAAPALEEQAADLGVGGDGQIRPRPHLRVQVAGGGGDALRPVDRDGDGEVAVLEAPVLVRQVLETGEPERLGRGAAVPGPALRRDAGDGDAAVLAVPRVVHVEVALDLAEVGQHGAPVPARGAARLPLVVVGRRAPVRHLPVDRGAAAQHPRLLVFPERRRRRVRVVVGDDPRADLQPGPVEARVEVGGAGVGVLDLLRHLARRRVLAGLQQQHAVAGAGREPVGEHGAGGAAADDDVAVLHALPPRPVAFWGVPRLRPAATAQSGFEDRSWWTSTTLPSGSWKKICSQPSWPRRRSPRTGCPVP
jgi:hypothetical protein